MDHKEAARQSASIGAELERIRESKGLSAYRVAQLTGLSDTYVRKVERGQHSPTLLSCLRIAAALGIRFGDVVNAVTGRAENVDEP